MSAVVAIGFAGTILARYKAQNGKKEASDFDDTDMAVIKMLESKARK